MQDDEWSQWFEAAWAHREEVVYPELFGDLGKGIYVLDPSLFLTRLRLRPTRHEEGTPPER